MAATSRRSLYALLKKLGQPRIDKGFRSSAPVFRLGAGRLGEKGGRSGFGSSPPVVDLRPRRDPGEPGPSAPISREQVGVLTDHVSWITWSVATERVDQQGSVQAKLRPAVSEGFAPLQERPGDVYSKWVHQILGAVVAVLAGLYSLGGIGRIIAVVLFLAALGGIVEAASTVPGLVTIVVTTGVVATLYILDARRNRYIRTVHAVDKWLGTAKELTERIPREWSEALQNAEVYDLVVEWMLSSPEVDALETHIAKGVQLHKRLSPVDSRRGTMQAEIEVQRSKRDALMELRADHASVITEVARAHLKKQKLTREAELEKVREARAAKLERENYQRRWSEIDAKEQARLKTHEQIDGWFDRGSSTQED